MFQRRMGRHSLLVVGQGCGLQPFAAVRRREDRGTASLSAPAVFASRFARLHGIACSWWGRVADSKPFAACSAAGGQRNSLAQRSGCFLHRALRDCAA